MKQGYVERRLPRGGEWFVSGLIGLATVLICITFMGQYGAPFGYIMGVILMISLGHILGAHTSATSFIDRYEEKILVVLGAVSLIIGVLFFLVASLI